MSKYQTITQQTKQNIIDAFWDLYSHQHIEKISVKAITNKAGYNRSTFYQYFKDVDDVLEQIELSLLPNLAELPPRTIIEEPSTITIDSLIKLYSKNSEYYSILLGDRGDPNFSTRLKNNIKQMIIDQLTPNQTMDIEFDYALEYQLSAMIGILTYWFKNNQNIDQHHLINLIYQLNNTHLLQELAKI